MLAPRYLAGISDDIVELYAQLEADILADMARRIKKIGAITDASKFQAGILEQCGGLKQDISKILSKYDKSTIQQVSSIFTDALQKSVEADNRIFQEATGRTVTENQAQAMIAAIQKTHSDLQSLTMTTAVTSQQDFIKQANAAYMEVSTGAFDYDTAMKHAADNLAEHGVTTVQYENGKAVTRTIESAVRMNILTGVNQTAAAVTMDNCDELNCNLVEVSAHEGARPEHAAWQGKVYSLNGRVMNDDGTVKYESFDVCGYGEVDGICGINCRHSFYPYFEGYSQQHYAQKDIEEMSKKDYEYNGQKMTRYEAEQTLRKTERTIRAYKRRITTEEAVGADTKSAQLKLGEWQARARDFTNQTGIKRDYAREYIGTTGVQPKALQSSKIVATKSVIKSATQQQTQAIATSAHAVPAPQTINGTYKVFKNATGSMDQFVQKAIDTQTMTPVQS